MLIKYGRGNQIQGSPNVFMKDLITPDRMYSPHKI